MIDGIWPLGLLIIAAAVSMLISLAIVFKWEQATPSRMIFVVGIAASLISLFPTAYSFIMPAELTAYAECHTSSERAPSTLICVADVPPGASIAWSIDGTSLNSDELSFEHELVKSGKTVIELNAKTRSLFRARQASFTTVVFLQGPLATEPVVMTVSKTFSERATTPRRFHITYRAEPGYHIVGAELQLREQTDVSDLDVVRSPEQVTVTGFLRPHRLGISGFKLNLRPAVVRGTVMIQQTKDD